MSSSLRRWSSSVKRPKRLLRRKIRSQITTSTRDISRYAYRYILSFNYVWIYGVPFSQMAEIGLRPRIGGQPFQFELSLHGQQKVYILQVLLNFSKLVIEGPFSTWSLSSLPSHRHRTKRCMTCGLRKSEGYWRRSWFS